MILRLSAALSKRSAICFLSCMQRNPHAPRSRGIMRPSCRTLHGFSDGRRCFLWRLCCCSKRRCGKIDGAIRKSRETPRLADSLAMNPPRRNAAGRIMVTETADRLLHCGNHPQRPQLRSRDSRQAGLPHPMLRVHRRQTNRASLPPEPKARFPRIRTGAQRAHSLVLHAASH